MNLSGLDELMTLTNDIYTHFGTEGPTDATTWTAQYQLPTRHAGREVAIFPLSDMQYPTAIGLCGHQSMRARAWHQVMGSIGRSIGQVVHDSTKS
jgi:hypothetical protein